MMSSEESHPDSADILESDIDNALIENPSELKARWDNLEWKSLLLLITETKSAPTAAGRLDLRFAPWDDIDLSRGSLRWADLRCATLKNAKLGGADLCGLDLRDAHAENTNFKGADLCAANFGKAALDSADFSFSDLSYAKFHGAVLRGATLTGADLSAVDFTDADLQDADLAGALYDSETKWPQGFEIADKGMILEE
ncbi:MAG: pentapeptide repeat-containing protein [Planctomycetota bacterium]|nr:pentapeptide repeat-containing protein [Planctomycetota bacterium]